MPPLDSFWLQSSLVQQEHLHLTQAARDGGLDSFRVEGWLQRGAGAFEARALSAGGVVHRVVLRH
eukprot:1492760-Amphidinium_carterae.1